MTGAIMQRDFEQYIHHFEGFSGESAPPQTSQFLILGLSGNKPIPVEN